MFVYARAPINFWHGWLTEDAYRRQLVELDTQQGELGGESDAIAKYEARRDAALALARRVGWEGDIREGPFIAGLPTDNSGKDGLTMIAWKQDNNGATFVVSPFRLPWLETGDEGMWTSV